MGDIGQPRRRVMLVLFLITILSPTILESETFGAGEHMALDAVYFQTRFGGVCWVLEWNTSRTLAPSHDASGILLPYISPVALLVSIFGILSLVAMWLALNKRISFRSGLLIIVLSSILLVLVPGINILRIEEFYTYRMQPLLIPQIACSLVLLWHHRSRIYESML
jgi:hypothetical protein